MESKKINQLATNLAPVSTDLTVIGNPTTGELKKITLQQIASIFGVGIGSIGMVVPSGFSVSPSTLTASGTFTITGAGTTSQYIRGDGSLATFPTSLSSDKLIQEVRNNSGATMLKGTIVYINGAVGNKATIAKALATSDTTSAQTYGVVQDDISNNSNGYVVVVGEVTGLDTSAVTEGQQLYLSGTIAGFYTVTKPYAPIHLVYVAIVLRSHPTLGVLGVKIQNGYEMDELHNVDAVSPSNNDGLFYNTTTSLWEHKPIATVLGYTPVTSARTISTTSPLSGGGDLTANRTLSIAQATGSVNGYLSSTDWTTFNNKQDNNLYTANGTLTSDRTITSNGYDLIFTNNQNASSAFYIKNTTAGTNSQIGINITSDASSGFSQYGKVSSTFTQVGIVTASDMALVNYTAGDISLLNSYASGKIKFGIGTDTGAMMTLTNDGHLLIGTTTNSTYTLDVNGTSQFTGDIFQNTGNFTGSSVHTYASNFSGGTTTDNATLGINNVYVNSLTTTRTQLGIINNIYLDSSSTAVTSGQNVYGYSSNVNIRALATGTFLTGYGSNINVNRTDASDVSTNSGSSLAAYASTISQTNGIGIVTGNIQSLYPTIVARTGTVTNMYSLRSVAFIANTTTSLSTTVTNYYGVNFATTVGAASGGPGVITNFYLLYLTAPTVNATGTITNRWGVYAPDSAMPHYFNGNVLIGTSTNSTYKLDVTGTGRITGVLTTNQGLIIDRSGNSPYIQLFQSSVSWGYIRASALDTIVFNTGGNVTMATINSTGLILGSPTITTYKINAVSPSTTTPTFFFERNTATTTNAFNEIGRLQNTAATIEMIDGFGSYMSFFARDVTAVDNEQARVGAARSGADNSASLVFYTNNAGTITEKWRINNTGVLSNVSSPNASAVTQIDSTTKGFLPPRMTTTQKNAIATPAAGLMVFDTTLVKLCVYSGSAWETITSI